MSKTKEVPTLVIGIWLKPQVVLNYLKIKVKLQHEDWQVIKQLPIGELGYDYEEGLRIYAPFDKSDEVLAFCKKMLADLNAPKKAISAEAVLRGNGYYSSKELTDKALQQGWVLQPIFKGDNSTLGIGDAPVKKAPLTPGTTKKSVSKREIQNLLKKPQDILCGDRNTHILWLSIALEMSLAGKEVKAKIIPAYTESKVEPWIKAQPTKLEKELADTIAADSHKSTKQIKKELGLDGGMRIVKRGKGKIVLYPGEL